MDFPQAELNRVRRGHQGKWVFCLGRRTRFQPGALTIQAWTEVPQEAAARIYFKKLLDDPAYYLVKLPQKLAMRLVEESEQAHKVRI